MKTTSKMTSVMKRLNSLKGMIAIATIAILSLGTVNAQKYAYVNSDYILQNIPEYKTAQQTLDNLSLTWQKEIEDKYAIIDKLYKAYQAEQVLLTEEMKKRRQDEITAKEKDVKDLQKQRFGYEGDLFKKKQEVVKPIQDKIYNAVKKMATDQSFAVIFDKSSDLIMLYTNPKYDKSNDILLAMGYKPAATPAKESGTKESGAKGGSTTPPAGGKENQTSPKENPDQSQPKK